MQLHVDTAMLVVFLSPAIPASHGNVYVGTVSIAEAPAVLTNNTLSIILQYILSM